MRELVEDPARAGRNAFARVAAQQDREVVGLEDRVRRVARVPAGVEQRRHLTALGLRRALVDRHVLTTRPGDVAAEVGQAPCHRDAEAARARLVLPLEGRERRLELSLRRDQRASVFLHAQLRRHDTMVKRRDDHLDPLVRDDLLADEQMLLAPVPDGREAALRRGGEAVDELVEAGGRQARRGRSGEEAPPGQPVCHPSTTPPSERSRAVTRRLEPSSKVT